METIFALLAICAENSQVSGKFPAQGQYTKLWFFLMCAWINHWVNNREAGDLKRHRTHYDVTVMMVMIREICLQTIILLTHCITWAFFQCYIISVSTRHVLMHRLGYSAIFGALTDAKFFVAEVFQRRTTPHLNTTYSIQPCMYLYVCVRVWHWLTFPM